MTNFWTHLWVVIQCSLAVPKQACKSVQHDFEVACNHTTGPSMLACCRPQCVHVCVCNVYRMGVAPLFVDSKASNCELQLPLYTSCNSLTVYVCINMTWSMTNFCLWNFYLVKLCVRFLFYVQQIASCYSDQWNTVSMFGAFTWTRPLFLASCMQRQPCIGMDYAWMRSFKCVCASLVCVVSYFSNLAILYVI